MNLLFICIGQQKNVESIWGSEDEPQRLNADRCGDVELVEGFRKWDFMGQTVTETVQSISC